MNVAWVIRQRLGQLELDQRDPARAMTVWNGLVARIRYSPSPFVADGETLPDNVGNRAPFRRGRL